MNSTIRSMLVLILAGTMLVGMTACRKKEKTPADTAQTVSAYETPEKYVTLPSLSSITVSNSEIDKQIAARIYELRWSKQYEDYQETTEASKAGDRVNISMTGRAVDEGITLSEATLKGISAEKTDYIIGTNIFVDAYYDDDENMLTDSYDNQLVGLKAGETKEIFVTFPDDYPYSEEIRGVKVVLTVTVHSVSRVTVTESNLLTVGYTTHQPEGDTNELSDFRALFPNGAIVYDPLTGKASLEYFGMMFKFADYAECFVGANKYDNVQIKVTVPENAGEDYADYIGKEITVNFMISSATTLPEWNDEFVKKYTGEQYKMTADYEAVLRRDLIAEEAYSKLFSSITIDPYPEAETTVLYDQYVKELIAQESGKSVEGLSDEEIIALVDQDDYVNICSIALEYARDDVKKRLIHEMLFKTLNITLTEEEYQTKLYEAYALYQPNADYYEAEYGIQIKNATDFENYYEKETLQGQFKLNKVKELLPEKITMVD